MNCNSKTPSALLVVPSCLHSRILTAETRTALWIPSPFWKLPLYLSISYLFLYLSRCEILGLPVQDISLGSSSVGTGGTGAMMGAVVLAAEKALCRLIGICRDSMLLCRPESLGYIWVSLGMLKPPMSSRPWEKLAELMLRTGAGLGVKHDVRWVLMPTGAGWGSWSLPPCTWWWSSVEEGRSRLLEFTLSRLAKEGAFT